jgi:hypothetical protein
MDMEGFALHGAVMQLHSGYKMNAFHATKRLLYHLYNCDAGIENGLLIW